MTLDLSLSLYNSHACALLNMLEALWDLFFSLYTQKKNPAAQISFSVSKAIRYIVVIDHFFN